MCDVGVFTLQECRIGESLPLATLQLAVLLPCSTGTNLDSPLSLLHRALRR
jgi:hypothetical protein